MFSVRDVVFSLILLCALPLAMRRPWIGVMAWTWVSVMSPHRLTWGFAWNQPWAAMIAIATLVGLLFSNEHKKFPATPITVLLVVMMVWMSVTTVFALHPDDSGWMWEKVMKIYFMLLITLAVLHTRKHIEIFVWITLWSVVFYGVKGGIFTIRGGGGERVWGPNGSFIEDNNSLALALVMCIPLLNYVRLTVKRKWIHPATLGAMVLCGFSVIGSHSRGALLAISAMAVVLWWRGKNKFLGLVGVAVVALGLLAFAPEKWEARMETIQTYETDGSAMGRINTWTMILNMIKDRPIVGGGFNFYSKDVFARWGSDPNSVHAAHSIYFQMLGEHGIPGLLLYLTLGILGWHTAAWIRRETRGKADYEWAFWLASMSQVSFVGFAVGGAFLSLAYWDVPYNLIVALVLTRLLLEKELVRKKSSKAIGPRRDANGSLIREPERGEAVPAVR